MILQDAHPEKKTRDGKPSSSSRKKSSTKKTRTGSDDGHKSLFEWKLHLDVRTLFILVFVTAFLYYAFSTISDEVRQNFPEQSLTQVVQDIKDEKVERVEVEPNQIKLFYIDDSRAIAKKDPSQSFTETLRDFDVNPNNVLITYTDNQQVTEIITILLNVIPFILMIALFIFIIRQARGAQESVFSFGQSRARRFNKDMSRITFKDVAGVDEAKNELEEVVDFLRHPDKYKKIGARTPKGVMLVGPAGCGKTLLAKAVAGEAGVPFFSIAGSEFMEMLVGIGAARVRDLFSTAKKSAPSIIFIDEIDAIGRARSNGVMPGHDEREQTLNQILVEMDGFAPTEQVIVVAATNRGDLLDSALLRPGRFDRRIVVDFPDVEGRKSIISIHAHNKPFTQDVDWERVAQRTVGFSGADLENMLNEAAIYAARRGRDEITMADIEEAATKVKLGPEKKRLQSDYDKKLTAYHEAGHAIVSHFLPHTDPVHRISIVSRGMALGYTLIPPRRDKLHDTKTNLIERIVFTMGGRAAEEIVFKEVTTGASNDFNQATHIARGMVVEYGMSKLGPINLGPDNDITQMSRTYFDHNHVSEEMQAKVDSEIHRILISAYDQAKDIITRNRSVLDAVALALLEKESLDKVEFEKIVGTKIEHKNSS